MNGTVNCEGISIGGIPDGEDLKALAARGVRTIVDVREVVEAGEDGLAKAAEALGLKYLAAPVSKTSVDVRQIDRFREVVGSAANAPVHVFSTCGRRPAGVLCFLACARDGESVLEVFHRAKTYGCSIDKETGLKKFILDFYSSHRGDMLNNHFQHQPA